jgi:hypothetical protein
MRSGERWQRNVRRSSSINLSLSSLAHSFSNWRVHLVDHPIHESATGRRAWRLSTVESKSAQCMCSDCIRRYVTRRPGYSPEKAVRLPVGLLRVVTCKHLKERCFGRLVRPICIFLILAEQCR